MQIGGHESLDDPHAQAVAAGRIEVFRNRLAVVPDLDGGLTLRLVSADRDGAAIPSREAVFDSVGDELVDQERQNRGLLRGDSDVTGWDIERHRESGRGQRPVRLVRCVAGNDVDGGAAETLLVAEEIVDSRDRLDATDRLSQVRRPGSTFVVAKLDRKEGGDGLQVIANAMV